jgi:hypothetical protein
MVALAVGIYWAKSDLIAPAAVVAVLLVIVIVCSLKGKTLKNRICLMFDVGILINLAGSLAYGGGIANEYWVEYVIIAPSFVLTAFGAVAFPVAYMGARFDRVLLSIFTAFTTLGMSSIYTMVYNLYIVVLVDEWMPWDDSIVANNYLNEQSVVMLMVSVVFVIAACWIMGRKNIKLLTAKKVLEA